MKTGLVTIALLIFYSCSDGQNKAKLDCKIEIYLLKAIKSNLDTTKLLQAEFSVNRHELGDTAFIKDFEITSYTISRDTTRKASGQNFVDERHRLKVDPTVIQRINNLKIPLCCGRQFAVVANGEIAFVGYFWNLHSSFGSDWITAFSYNTYIDLMRKLPDFDFTTDSNDPRRSQTLFNCLVSTNRLIAN